MNRSTLSCIQIDLNVKPLVMLLNKISFVGTNSSCGGHAVKTNCSQVDKGKFQVDCIIENKKFLLFLREFSRNHPGFTVTRWSEGGGTGWRYDIKGTHEHMRLLEQNLRTFIYVFNSSV